MEGGISPDAKLDSVEFHIFPSQNRYEASVWSSNKEENVAAGPLEHLLLLSPDIKNLSSKGSDTNFKILRPESVNDAGWFTTNIITRFLHIIGLPEIISIGKEISQLEETRNFQLSLSDKAEADIRTSVESKNELLLAVDLRLTALKEELAAAFNQAIGSKNSPKDISDLENFALQFGAKILRDSLQNSVKLSTIPSEVAMIEQQCSTEDENSTLSSEEDNLSVERSRGLTRSTMPRRSASPMKRIQIGRSGSRRAAALSIKSLNYFPAREKSTSQRDAAGDSSEEEDSQRPAKNNVLRMSVQDKISLFESKQRDQGVDIQKTKTIVGANKVVLRRWSSEIGERAEVSSPSSPKNIAPDGKTEPDSYINGTETCVETSEKNSFLPEKGEPEQLRMEDGTPEPENDEICEKNPDSVDCTQKVGAELNGLLTKQMESKPVGHQDVTGDYGINKSPKEQRGGLFDPYQKRGEEKLRGKASGKIVEKEAKMASAKMSGANRRHTARNEPQKTQKNSTQLINSRTIKSSAVNKSTPKSSPLPATRKSWPSTPSPQSAGASPARTPTGPTYRKPHSAASVGRSSTKAENLQPQLKAVKATQASNKRIRAMNEKKHSMLSINKRITKANIQTPQAESTAIAKPSLYNKVTKKGSVFPLETKPFLRKGSGIGPGVGPVIKTKVVAQKTEEHKVVTRIEIDSQNQENEYGPPENSATSDLEPQVASISPTKCEELEISVGDGGDSRAEVSEINTVTEEELEISPSAWVEIEEYQEDEIIPCSESPIQLASPTNVTAPAGFAHPRIRHSLSQMLLEDDNETDISEWGHAEHPPTMVYQKDSSRGLKRLLKFARKAKADSHLTGWSSPSTFSEGEEDTEEFKGQSSLSRFNGQNHQRVPEGHVSVSMTTTKATRSFFSLSAIRGNKTNDTKLLRR